MAGRDLSDLHEQAHSAHGIKDLVLAQNRGVHVLALEKFIQHKNIDQDTFREDVRAFARKFFKQKKDLLFKNTNYVLYVKYPLPNVCYMNDLA